LEGRITRGRGPNGEEEKKRKRADSARVESVLSLLIILIAMLSSRVLHPLRLRRRWCIAYSTGSGLTVVLALS